MQGRFWFFAFAAIICAVFTVLGLGLLYYSDNSTITDRMNWAERAAVRDITGWSGVAAVGMALLAWRNLAVWQRRLNHPAIVEPDPRLEIERERNEILRRIANAQEAQARMQFHEMQHQPPQLPSSNERRFIRSPRHGELITYVKPVFRKRDLESDVDYHKRQAEHEQRIERLRRGRDQRIDG